MKNQTQDEGWLSSYVPVDITPINSDPTMVQISLLSTHKHKHDKVPILKTLLIPKRLQSDPLCLAIIAYCKSEEFLSLAPGTRERKYSTYLRLFNFLDKNYGRHALSDVTAIHPEWIKPY
ncbi:hypothetical protein [Vibrio parahaemolyticus]|uniref:hypothetical protein n=1 Tax=Vibrio parahaemolyticus TaxID=670 RepID=UPI00111DD8D7|nr:hypothetical protein [Vibrio parahaemolyticus]TOM14869.1 hypothetical protein CGH82_22325 [Vibrio parahaemolyticus]HCG8599752.1 hypothetical protein [Vibrio parahaemolyticus]